MDKDNELELIETIHKKDEIIKQLNNDIKQNYVSKNKLQAIIETIKARGKCRDEDYISAIEDLEQLLEEK